MAAFPRWQRRSCCLAGFSSCLQPQDDASVSIPAGPWLNSRSGLWKGGNVNIFLSRSCELVLSSQRSRFLQRAQAELCCHSGLLPPWCVFPKSLFLPLFEGWGSSNAAAAAISFYAEGSGAEPLVPCQSSEQLPGTWGYNAQGRSQDVVVSLPHQPWALQSPHRTNPNHHNIPKYEGL